MAVRMYATGQALTLKDDSWTDEKFLPYCNLEINGDEFNFVDYMSKGSPDHKYDLADIKDAAGATIGDGLKATVKAAITDIIFA